MAAATAVSERRCGDCPIRFLFCGRLHCPLLSPGACFLPYTRCSVPAEVRRRVLAELQRRWQGTD